jgi:hypothetical protein
VGADPPRLHPGAIPEAGGVTRTGLLIAAFSYVVVITAFVLVLVVHG